MIKNKELLNQGYLLSLWLIPFYLPVAVLAASNFGSIYVFSAWKEFVLFGLLLLLIKPVLEAYKTKDAALRFLNIIIGAYIALAALYIFKAESLFEFTAGFLFSTRFLLFFILAQIMALRINKLPEKLKRLVLITGVILAALAILQALFLPPTLLQHIGYEPLGVETPGFPPAVTTLGEVDDFIRPQATLRGPNPLGAFLVLPISLLVYSLLKEKRRDPKTIGALVVIGAAMLLTFSRSAWLAAFFGSFGILLYTFREKLRSTNKKWLALGLASLVLVSVVALDNKTVRVIVLREEADSSVRLSDDIRRSLTKEAWKDVVSNPLGRGPGNAGPVSVLDTNDKGRIAENYFLQVAQETGWLGLSLFIIIHMLLLKKLWDLRSNSLALVAFTSLCGLIFANLTLHTWSDEAVSIIWWSFAGAIIGSYLMPVKERAHGKNSN
jgi:O-antigen ligase